MKHIKKFDEKLKSSTYIDAASKLRKFGYEDRYRNLMDWSRKIKGNILKDKIKEFSPFGTFKLNIGECDEDVSQGDFHLKISFNTNSFNVNIDKWKKKDPQNFKGYFCFNVDLIPANEETLKKCMEISDKKIIDCGFLSGWEIKIIFKVSDGIVDVETFYLTEIISDISFSDRPTTGRFKNLFKKIFTNQNLNYPSGCDDEIYLYQKINYFICAEHGFSADYGFNIEDLGKFMDKLSANQLYASSRGVTINHVNGEIQMDDLWVGEEEGEVPPGEEYGYEGEEEGDGDDEDGPDEGDLDDLYFGYRRYY